MSELNALARRQGRECARRMLNTYRSAYEATHGAAMCIADAVASGGVPHPAYVYAYRLLDRLVGFRGAVADGLLAADEVA